MILMKTILYIYPTGDVVLLISSQELAITSSEASVLFITLISIDRYVRIKYPYARHRLRVKSAKLEAAILCFVVVRSCSYRGSAYHW